MIRRECRAMFCCECPKTPEETGRPDVACRDEEGTSRLVFQLGEARAILEQLWSTISTRGLSVLNKNQVALLARKAFFIPPRT